MKIDMSPEAVEARLRRVSQLRDLCLFLGKSGKATNRTTDSPAKPEKSAVPPTEENDN